MKRLFNSPHRIGGMLAAGAALASWMLLAPPPSRSGVSVNIQASLSQWLNYGTYDSLNQCARAISDARNGASSGPIPSRPVRAAINNPMVGESANNQAASNNYAKAPYAERSAPQYGANSNPEVRSGAQGDGMINPMGASTPNSSNSNPQAASGPRLTPAQLSSAYCVSSDDPRFKDMFLQQAAPSGRPTNQAPSPMTGGAPAAFGGAR